MRSKRVPCSPQSVRSSSHPSLIIITDVLDDIWTFPDAFLHRFARPWSRFCSSRGDLSIPSLPRVNPTVRSRDIRVFLQPHPLYHLWPIPPPLAFQVWKSETSPYTWRSSSTILGWNLSSPIISVVAFLLPYHHFPWTPSLTSKYPIRASPGGPCVNPVVFPTRLAAHQPFLSRPW